MSAEENQRRSELEAVNYDARIHGVYNQGRALTVAQAQVWHHAFARHLPSVRPLLGAEIGSGTGRFTPLLADWFGGPVVGIEPFAKMREQALAHAQHPQVNYLAGRAEELPLASQSVDYALMFLVWHHVEDHEQAAAELFRILRPGGTLLLRAKFSDHLPHHWWLKAFPNGLETDAAAFQTLNEVRGTLFSAGFAEQAFEVVLQPASGTRQQVLERLKHRSLSVFEHMTEAQLTEGFTTLEQWVKAEPDLPIPKNPATLLVLRRPA